MSIGQTQPGPGPTPNGFYQMAPDGSWTWIDVGNKEVGVDGYYDANGNFIAYGQWTYNKDGSAFRSSRPSSISKFNMFKRRISPIPQNNAPSQPISISVKQANPDIVIFDEEIDPDFLVQAFFEEFGGTELINISRSDLINGDQVSYTPIINLSTIRQSFNPNNIIAIGAYQENPTKYGIDLFSRGVINPYFNDEGDLVIEIDDIRADESIEIEIASDGTISRIEL